MHRLHAIKSLSDIPQAYRNTPIESLLAYHNLGKPFASYTNAQLLIGMCMDSRKNLNIPDNFAFILRAGGANLRMSGFKVSYAIAVGGIKYIALIAHTQCGMVNVAARKEQFIEGLVENAGWSRQQAEDHFNQFAPQFEIGDAVNFIASEAERLRKQYPRIPVAPMIYKIEDGLLYCVTEESQ